MTETVTIDGTVYDVDRDVADEWSTSTSEAVCALTAQRRGTWTLISRDKIAHGAFLATGSTKLEKLPSARLRAALEPLFGPFPTVTPRACGSILALLAAVARTPELAEFAASVQDWTPSNRKAAEDTAIAHDYLARTPDGRLAVTAKGDLEIGRALAA